MSDPTSRWHARHSHREGAKRPKRSGRLATRSLRRLRRLAMTPGVLLALIGCSAAPHATTSDAPRPHDTSRATIHRDAWGTPHVRSRTDAGVLYGMAWALAEDDWPLMEENYLHALGRHAELVGEPGVEDDWMARALGIVPLSVREYEAASPRMRGLLDGFAAGLNAWLARQPEGELRVLRRVEPWYPLALIRYKYYQNEFLGYAGLEGGLARRLFQQGWRGGRVSSAALRGLDDAPRYAEAQFAPDGIRPRGSNTWAVAPARTAAGHALLLINPHQSFVGVQRYAELHLDSDEGLRFSGLTVFGFLLPYMGHNDRLGWAYTDNYADHSDLYAERFDHPTDSLRYRYDGGWRSAETWTETVAVRDGDRRELRFWRTHHGPIVGVADDGRPLAVRMARYEEGGWFDQWDRMIRARTLDEWRAALGMLRVAYMNTMYADADGNIGYVYNSAVPRRRPGLVLSTILDGADPTTEWQGFHPLEELPQVWNPSTGWLLNTNSTPFTATTGLPFDRDDFPPYMVGDEEDNVRARSSRRVLEDLRSVTFEEFARVVWDTRLTLADSLVPALVEEWRRSGGGGGAGLADTSGRVRLGAAVERLARWDRVADTGSVETTWFVLMAEHWFIASRRGTVAVSLVEQLGSALAALEERWGTAEVPWGRINRHQRPLVTPPALDTTRPSLAVGGAPGALGAVFSYSAEPFGSAGPRLGRAGNSFVKVVEFAPTVHAHSILNYGQSGDPRSPHFFDQAALYARREFKPAWFHRADVDANAVRRYAVP